MARRIRTIKPEILDDEVSAGLPDAAWRLWVSMWLLADDAGRLRGSGSWLRGQVFWARTEIDDEKTDALISILETSKVIVRYRVDDQTYFQVRTWRKHQRIDRPRESKIPPPSEDLSTDHRRQLADGSCLDLDQGSGSGSGSPIQPLLFLPETKLVFDFGAVYSAYPRKEGKAKGLAKLATTVKSQADYVRCLQAAKNYATSRIGEDATFTKHFSSWASCWEDYVDLIPAVGSRRSATRDKRPEDIALEEQEHRARMRIERERSAK